VTRAFLDANVIFAAAISPSGLSARLLDFAGEHSLLASPHVIEEARRNVVARYADSTERLRGLVLPRLEPVGEAAGELITWARQQGLPEMDAPVLAAAVQADADILVTGDRTHFGALFGKRLRGVEVVTLRQAVERLGGS